MKHTPGDDQEPAHGQQNEMVNKVTSEQILRCRASNQHEEWAAQPLTV